MSLHTARPGERPLGLALALGLSLAGCSGESKAPEAASVAAMGSDAFVGRMTGSDHGLELLKLAVVDRPELIGAALGGAADSWSLDAGAAQRLRQNGLRMVRVPLEQLAALPAQLGGPTLNQVGWHGQVVEWRELVSAPIGSAGRAIAVDGRVMRLAPGQIRLLTRAWTLPTEDGPRLHLELAPQYRQAQVEEVSLLPRGHGSGRSITFDSAAVQLELQPGWAYVLTCESPDVEWPGAATAAGQMSGASEPPGAGQGPSSDDGLGPNVAAPLTLGQMLLLSQAVPANRGFLVFVPRIPEQWLPPPPPLAPVQTPGSDEVPLP